MTAKWDAALHPRDFIGQFTSVSGSDKRLKKIRKTRAKLDKANADFVATATVRTKFGGQRPLTTAEARRFLNDTNVQVNRVQGHTASRRRAAQQVIKAKNAHLKNFGRSIQPLKQSKQVKRGRR